MRRWPRVMDRVTFTLKEVSNAVLVFIIPVFIALSFPSASQASEAYYKYSGSNWGGAGLLQMRNARFHADGTIDVGAVLVEPYRRYFVNFQAMPWLETTFRYTDIRNRLFSNFEEFSGGQSFKDRGIDFKIGLWKESKYLPKIAFGWQDALGTGLFSSEYLAFSKRFYDLDFTVGVAWGLLGSAGNIKNPFIAFSKTLEVRQGFKGQGGEANLASFLSGPTIGLFGGIEWSTPVDGLILKLEYDGNDYQNEPLGNNFSKDLPLNFGVVYQPFSWLEATAAFERGNTVAFRVSLRTNVHEVNMPKFDAPPPLVKTRRDAAEADAGAKTEPRRFDEPGAPTPVRPQAGSLQHKPEFLSAEKVHAPETAADDRVVGELFDSLSAAGFELENIEFTASEVRAVLRDSADGEFAVQAARAARIIATTLPVPVEKVTLIEADDAQEVRAITIDRSNIERTAIVDHLFDSLESRGYIVEALDISEQEVSIAVDAASPTNDADARVAARAVFTSLPALVERAAFIHMRAGVEVKRFTVKRDQVKRQARIDDLFDNLEARGFEVESLELARGRAVAHLLVSRSVASDAYETAAQLISDTSPEPLNQVVVVGMEAGMEVSRFVLKRNARADGRQTGDSDQTEGTAITEQPQEFSRAEKEKIAAALIADLEKQNFVVDAVELTMYRATVFVSPTKFRQLARNIGRAARVVANHIPQRVEEITIVTLAGGLETSRVTIARSDLERAVDGRGSAEEIWAHAILEAPHAAIPPRTTLGHDAVRNPARYPSFSWGLTPKLRQHVGGPDQFYLYQIWLALSGTVELARGLSVTTTLGKDVKNTFDEIELSSDSRLPRVRSDIKEYLQQGKDNIVRLQANYLFQPYRHWFARVSAGLFEEMFGGVGGEVLYRPYGSRLAISADINRVRQRAFDQRFNFLDYQVTTGHLNLYYKLPFAKLLGEVHAGQFLAGDRGAQFALSRQFDSGVRVGAWATFTNVSAADFGEGSFDKGFFITVPYELFLVNSTRRGGTFGFRPLTRDGGQRLSVGPRLYPLAESGNVDAVTNDWDTFLD